MSSEEQNKTHGWKNNLLLWERSGTVRGRKELLWEKLQDRLQPKNKKNKIYFAWAAIVVFSISTFLLLLQKKPTTGPFISVQPVVIHKPAAFPDQINIPGKTTPILKTSFPVTRKKKNVTLPPVKIDLIPSNPLPLTEKQEPILLPEQPVVQIPAKKKLRIIHLNEWNAPPPPTYASLKEYRELELRRQAEEEITTGRSIWPGKNRNRLPVLPAN